MKVLALDTSTLMATCAVIEDDRLIGEFSLNQDMSHSEKLVPMIKEILDNLKLKVEDIDLYGVSIGPGSFTGLRIGLATIKAFAHIFEKPLVGVSSLEGLAYNQSGSDFIVPMIDARRDRVYTGIYKREAGDFQEKMGAAIYHIDDLIELLSSYENLVALGDGASLHREKLEAGLGNKLDFVGLGQNNPRASSIGELALIKYRQGISHDYMTLAPDYLRPSQAERELALKMK